ncbi:BRCA1-A complex subunit RAP80 isoform X2 [Spea bombifrons]|uniref:BRCA1-A complex subunit RAP80 isoform X2 n=1 Tax=Spea bombifrons TaxID=233779 RepID=UPI00234ADC22|nr:BRCA1-A complex subunit RAP80 isoform X2 [Spea bombifrons]
MPPRKRRKSHSEGDDWQCSSKEDGSHSRPDGSPGRNRSMESPLIVISDSDGENTDQGNCLPKKRGRLQLDRRRTVYKRRIAQMTEEEQLALAVKISEREANHINYSNEEENELLRKAIEESLHSCSASDVPEKNTEVNKSFRSYIEFVGPEEVGKELPSSQRSDLSGVDTPKSPMVSLTRLSQDIVESSSVILSPNCRDPILETETVPCLSNLGDFVTNSPTNKLVLSPVFPKQPPHPLKLVPRKLFPEASPHSHRPQEDLDDQCSHCSETPQLDLSSEVPSSMQSEPLNENSSSQKAQIDEKTNLCGGSALNVESKDLTSKASPNVSGVNSTQGHQSEAAVHYYWGIPFCPKGVDPNAYTQVILCQLEVYQKSLKKAQRRLLNKMDFNEPLVLGAPSSHENEQERGDSQDSITQEESEEVKYDKCGHRVKEWEDAGNSDKSLTQHGSSGRKPLASPVHSHPDEENSRTLDEPASSYSQTLFPEGTPGEVLGDPTDAVNKSYASQTDEENEKSPPVHNGDVPEEEEITVCPETQPSPAEEQVPEVDKMDLQVLEMENEGLKVPDEENVEDLEVPEEEKVVDLEVPEEETEDLNVPEMETVGQEEPEIEDDNIGGAQSSSEPGVSVVPLPEQTAISLDVECPLCGQQFPPLTIEMHAAYCDGTIKTERLETTVLRSSRQKSAKKSLVSPGDLLPAPDTGKCEKCYMCKTLVPLREYATHVDSCMENVKESEGRRRESTGRGGRLLNMLQQSESTSEEAHCSAQEPDYKRNTPPREEQSGSLNAEHLGLSDSPIRAFVSISEATDCLIDFKKQFSRQPRNPRQKGRRRRQ